VEKKSFQNENSRRKRKNEKRGRKSTDRKLHFSKQTEREKNNVFLQKRVIIKLVLSQTRSFEEEEEERGLHSRRGIKKFFSHTRGWVFCAREKERERDFAFVVEKSSPISEAAASSSSSSSNLLSITSSSARTFKKRREK
jgi:hypothetical protein